MRHDTAVFGSAFGYGGGESALLATLALDITKICSGRCVVAV